MLQAEYDWNIEPLQQPEERQTRKVKRIVKKNANVRKKLLGKIGVAVFLYGLLLIYLCIKSATLGYQIVQMENDIDDLQTANKRLEYQIAEKTSLDRVEKIASTELGMYKPESSIAIAALPEVESTGENKLANMAQPDGEPGKKGSSFAKLYDSLLQLASN